MAIEIETSEANFNKFIDSVTLLSNGCWKWKNANPKKYTQICIDLRKEQAHRFSYRSFFGDIPEGMVVDHTCFNRYCVNPNHLDAVTQKVNVNRAHEAGRGRQGYTFSLHCKHGHRLSGDAVVWDSYEVRGGKPYKRRRCLECGRKSAREYQRRKRANRST